MMDLDPSPLFENIILDVSAKDYTWTQGEIKSRSESRVHENDTSRERVKIDSLCGTQEFQ